MTLNTLGVVSREFHLATRQVNPSMGDTGPLLPAVRPPDFPTLISTKPPEESFSKANLTMSLVSFKLKPSCDFL